MKILQSTKLMDSNQILLIRRVVCTSEIEEILMCVVFNLIDEMRQRKRKEEKNNKSSPRAFI